MAAAAGPSQQQQHAAAVPAAAISVPAAFRNLVKVLAGMFYAGKCPPDWWIDAADPKSQEPPDPDAAMWQQDKTAAQLAREAKRKQQQDTTGLGVILLTALTEVQWVEEDEFARSLNLPPKMVRRSMRFLEQEQLVQREHRKESVRLRKHERALQIQAGLRPLPQGGAAAGSSAAAAAAAAAAAGGGAGAEAAAAAAAGALSAAAAEDEPIMASKGHIITYVALDYPRVLDSVRWRLATVKKRLQSEIRNDHTVQAYRCSHPKCGKQFTSMDVFQLMPSPADLAAGGSSALTCSVCGSEIKMLLDEGGRELGSMEDKKERQKKARAMLASMDAALAPLTSQLAAVEGITPPDFHTYATWLHNQAAIKQRLDALAKQAAENQANGNKRSTAAPTFDANTRVVINFADKGQEQGAAAALPGAAAPAAAAAAGGSGPSGTGPKPLPPWMAKAVSQQAQQQPQAAAKPIPPWLSAQKQAAAAAAAAAGGGAGGAIGKPDPGASFIKDETAVKLEAGGIFKQDPHHKQDPGDDDDGGDWEDVAGGAPATADTPALSLGGSAMTGGASLGNSDGGLAAVLDEEEDWEDV